MLLLDEGHVIQAKKVGLRGGMPSMGSGAMLLKHVLSRMVRVGRLTVIDANGDRHVFAGKPGNSATIRFHDRSLHRKLLIYPDLYLGEAYMDGTLTVEDGTLYDFLSICFANYHDSDGARLFRTGDRVIMLLRRLHQLNPVAWAGRNVSHHYDLPDRLYDVFLDHDRQYSCAYFRRPDDDLETAQENKKRHLAAKLLLRPGQRVLDIGCGWGGLALYLARQADVTVTGITLSKEQLAVAQRRAKAAGLDDKVVFRLVDYRELEDRFDRIVSVGMFEHVGVNHYDQYFRSVRSLLAPKGIALLHSIGRMAGPSTTSAWIRKYIFPGGYSPALSEVLPAVERTGLWITDVEILRLHYAETLRHWRQRFETHRAEIAELRDERFCRMWEFYLISSELAFRLRDHMVFQMQLANRPDVVPITRDYIHAWDEERAIEINAQAAE